VRFGVVHRLMTNALAAFGVLALVSSGQFTALVSAIVLVGLAVALAIPEAWARHPSFRHVDTITLLGVVAIQVVRFATGANSLDVLIEFAAALQIVRLATRRGAAHDQQVIVLALLHLIAGTVLGGGLGYGLCFAGVLVVAPGALVLSHLRREVEGNYRQGARDRTGLPVDVPRILRSRRVVGRTFLASMCLLCVPIILFTGVLFIFFPRVGLSLLLLGNRDGTQMIGFSDRVDLGQVGRLREDRSVALRVQLSEMPSPPPQHMTFHLRGTALDRYSSKGTWSQSDDSRIPLAPSGANPVSVEPGRVVQTKAPTMEVTLDPIEPPVLFVPAGATGVMLKSPSVALPNQHPYLIRGPGGELRYHTEERGVSYTVFLGGRSGPPRGSLSPSERRKYLQVPEDLSEELRALAAEWVDGAATDREKASAVLQRLRTDFAYDLDSPSTRADVPLDDFLFESKRGHCSFFSSAMAIMLRTQGIPTRNVTGFAGGTYNKYSESYVVRQGDAHSWVEVWLDDAGWVTFDPTPAAGEGSRTVLSEPWSTLTDFIEATSQRWNHHVVQYDLDRQYALLSGLGDGEDDESTSGGIPWRLLVLLALAGAAVGLGVTLWRRRRKKTAAVRVGDGPRSKELARATALYESLEQALAVHGITRPPGTPPLKHAEALVATEHPVGEETLEVTKVYLAVRFGKMTLSTEADADLSRRIRSIREQPRTGGPS
jgi:hypothetical protein